MKVAVWDTYVKSQKGMTLHFDIIVPETQKDTTHIYAYGRQHLTSLGEPGAAISTEQCQFCHIEAPSADILQAIRDRGFYILEMEPIPADLPAVPTRRDMILHLRAHYAEHRFANFKNVTDDGLRKMIAALK